LDAISTATEPKFMKGTSSLYLKAVQDKVNKEIQDPSQQILSGCLDESLHCSKSVENNFCFFCWLSWDEISCIC